MMAIKSKVKSKEYKKQDYPILVSSDNVLGLFVVLLYSQREGVVVYSEREDQPLGYSSTRWVFSKDDVFDGVVELKNN